MSDGLYTLEKCDRRGCWVVSSVTPTRGGGLSNGSRHSRASHQRYRLKDAQGIIIAAWARTGTPQRVELGRIERLVCVQCGERKAQDDGLCHRCASLGPAPTIDREVERIAKHETMIATLMKPDYVPPERPPVFVRVRGEVIEKEIVWYGR